MLSARSSAVRKRLGNLDKVTVEYIEACGDCFYLAMEAALSEEDGWSPYFAVATMRDVVASSMTEDVYKLYTLLHEQQADGVWPAPALRSRPLRAGEPGEWADGSVLMWPDRRPALLSRGVVGDGC